MTHRCILLTLFFLIETSLWAQHLNWSNHKAEEPLNVVDLTSSVNYGFSDVDSLRQPIDVIVLHSSYCVGQDTFSLQGVMRQYQRYGVSPHYIVDRNGIIYRTVPEEYVAYHAGISQLPGTERTGMNYCSIGIEIINTPSQPPTDMQYRSLALLVKDIRRRYEIGYIVGHADVAPGRKTDPWAFDWSRFRQMLEE